MAEYHVIVEPDTKYWFVTVPGVGCTQARNLSEVEPMVKDLVHLMTGDEQAVIVQSIKLPESIEAHIAESKRQRVIAETSTAIAARESREAAKGLRALGMTLRDIGNTLGVSYQRAHQLVNA